MYAIRNRSDPSIFFHAPESSHQRRTTMTFRRGAVPRLFKHRKHASLALSNWVLAGPSVIDAIRLNIPFRSLLDWEIIPTELKEVKGDEAQSQTTA